MVSVFKFLEIGHLRPFLMADDSLKNRSRDDLLVLGILDHLKRLYMGIHIRIGDDPVQVP